MEGKKAADNSGIQFSVQEGTNYVTVTIDGTAYEGVIVDMTDEAGNDTRCISAVSGDNRSVWVVHYK